MSTSTRSAHNECYALQPSTAPITMTWRRHGTILGSFRRRLLVMLSLAISILSIWCTRASALAFHVHGSVSGFSMKRETSSFNSLAQEFSTIRSTTFITSTSILKSEYAVTMTEEHRPLPSFLFRGRTAGIITMMGKGDGKKKRKKKTALIGTSNGVSSSASSNPSPPQPVPLRVTNQINVPVKRQIRYAQMNKQAAKLSKNPGFRQQKVVRTKYRRTWDEEEIEVKAEERRRKGQNPDWDVILNRTASSPLMIVDGYNIIHKWPRLKKHMSKGDTQRARQLLVEDLENLRSLKGWRIECVFDGAGKSITGPLGDGPGRTARATTSDRALKKEVSKHGVRVVFTGVGVEADSYIEARCAKAKNVTSGELTGSFILATDDSMIRLAGQSAGAMCMSADRFVDELKSMKKAIDYRVEFAMAKVNGNAIRPEKLRGTSIHVGRFGRGSVVIEDKRNRTKAKKEKAEEQYEIALDIAVEEDENGIPWWAQVPNHTLQKIM